MKIIQVLNTWEYFGAENVAIGICEGLHESGIEVAYASRIGSIEDVVRQHGVRFIGLKDVSVREVRRMILSEKADVVHAHDMFASVVCALATIGTKCRLVTMLHNNGFENRRISVKSVLYLIAMIRTRKAFFVSKSTYEGYIFHKWFAKKSEILGNIIDVENVIKKGKNVKKEWDIVYVGRLFVQKDPLRLIKVIGMIRDIKPELKVAIVGNGEMTEETREEVQRLGLEGNVELMGFRDDAIEIMAASRVMLMTSRWEGTPMVVLEAMALHVPVVATPVDGLKEVVNEKWLCDKDEDLVAAVIDLLDNGCDDYVWHVGMSRSDYIDKLMQAYSN